MKKNDKCIVYGKKATIIGNPWRMFSEQEKYVEVLLHDEGIEVPVNVKDIHLEL